jgi:PPOX class probable F420-dependent enzyme
MERREDKETMVKLTEDLLELLRQPSTCYICTLMKDGSPQITQTWVDTDGEHVIINSVQGYVKIKNIKRDPRVAVVISTPDNPRSYFQIRGRVINVTTDGGAEHIEKLSLKYTGKPYSWYGGRDQVRMIITIAPEKISGMGGGWGRRPAPAS